MTGVDALALYDKDSWEMDQRLGDDPQTSWGREHVERVRDKAKVADGLGDFWRTLMVSACNQLLASKKQTDAYGLALMMIREGCADPQAVAGDSLAKYDH